MNRVEPIVTTKTFIRRLHVFLRDKSHIIELKKLHGASGKCHEVVEKIDIDYRNEMLSTLIHEVIHFYWSWSETDVLWHEKYYMDKITVRQVKTILKKFVENL